MKRSRLNGLCFPAFSYLTFFPSFTHSLLSLFLTFLILYFPYSILLSFLTSISFLFCSFSLENISYPVNLRHTTSYLFHIMVKCIKQILDMSNRYRTLFPYKFGSRPSFSRHTQRSRIQKNGYFLRAPEDFESLRSRKEKIIKTPSFFGQKIIWGEKLMEFLSFYEVLKILIFLQSLIKI